MARIRIKDHRWEQGLEQLRGICGGLPGVVETLTYGNPTFKVANKTFAVLDIYQGSTCVWLACGPAEREALLGQEGFFPAPYDRAKAAVCRSIEALDWSAFSERVKAAYERCL